MQQTNRDRGQGKTDLAVFAKEAQKIATWLDAEFQPIFEDRVLDLGVAGLAKKIFDQDDLIRKRILR